MRMIRGNIDIYSVFSPNFLLESPAKSPLSTRAQSALTIYCIGSPHVMCIIGCVFRSIYQHLPPGKLFKTSMYIQRSSSNVDSPIRMRHLRQR